MLGNIDAPITDDLQEIKQDLNGTVNEPEITINSPFGVAQAPAPAKQGFFDSIGSSFSATRKYQATIGNKSGNEDVLNDQLDTQYSLMQQHKVIPSNLGVAAIVPSAMEDFIRTNPEYMDMLKKTYPDAGFQNYEDIQKKTIEEFQNVTDQMNAAARNTTSIGLLGELAGGMVGFLQSPKNAAVAFGAGAAAATAPVTGVLGTTAMVGLTELIANIYLETENKPGELAIRRALGEDISNDQALTESVSNVVLATTLAAAVGGAGRLLSNHLKKGTPQYTAVKEAMDHAEDVRQMVGDPPPGVKFKDHHAQQTKAYADVMNDTYLKTDTATPIKYERLSDTTIVREVDGTISTRPGRFDAEQKIDLDNLDAMIDPKSTASKFDTLYNELSQPGKDIVIDSVDDLGNATSYSVKAQLEAIKQDKTAYDLVSQCLAGGLGAAV